MGKNPSLLSKCKLTLALPWADLVAEPAQIKSTPDLERKFLKLCSPKTHLTASTTFDLPEPFGPTIALTAVGNSKSVLWAKDLKPEISNFISRRDAYPLLRRFLKQTFGIAP